MILTLERAQVLEEYLVADVERGKELLEMPVENALVKINADGYDFTIEELQEFDQALVEASQKKNEELNEDELGEVFGGCLALPIAVGMLLWVAGRWARR